MLTDKQKDEHYLVINSPLHTLETQDHKTLFIITVETERERTLSTPLLCFTKTWQHVRTVIHHLMAYRSYGMA